jgi:acyl-coenzyme A synthetase/AMP-(fatty) acid ligase
MEEWIGWGLGATFVAPGQRLCGAMRQLSRRALYRRPLLPPPRAGAADPSRYWDVVERHRVTQFYTAPTAIRALMRYGSAPVDKHDLSSLRVLGSVGEPINPEAWRWYHSVVGRGRCR